MIWSRQMNYKATRSQLLNVSNRENLKWQFGIRFSSWMNHNNVFLRQQNSENAPEGKALYHFTKTNIFFNLYSYVKAYTNKFLVRDMKTALDHFKGLEHVMDRYGKSNNNNNNKTLERCYMCNWKSPINPDSLSSQFTMTGLPKTWWA